MESNFVWENGCLTIRLPGELDHTAADELRRKTERFMKRYFTTTIIFDFQNTQFMDSSGVGLVLGRMRELHAVNGRTIILNPSPTMEKIFRFSGLAAYMMHGAEETAISQARGIVNG